MDLVERRTKMSLKKYFNSFLKEEDGAEIVEYLAIIVVAAALIVVIAAVGVKMQKAGTDASDSIDKALQELEKFK